WARAWGAIGRCVARSVAVAGPSVARAARIVRRVGAASATKTCSATASRASGIQVVRQLGQLPRPALAVGVVRVAPRVDRQLGEAGLDDAQPRPVAVGLQGELHRGAAGVVRRGGWES